MRCDLRFKEQTLDPYCLRSGAALGEGMSDGHDQGASDFEPAESLSDDDVIDDGDGEVAVASEEESIHVSDIEAEWLEQMEAEFGLATPEVDRGKRRRMCNMCPNLKSCNSPRLRHRQRHPWS